MKIVFSTFLDTNALADGKLSKVIVLIYPWVNRHYYGLWYKIYPSKHHCITCTVSVCTNIETLALKHY